MNRNQAFGRKIIYLSCIAVLFIPISRLCAPATTRNEGGILSQLRKEDRLSQAQLGKIDPASASMSLATLGLRGVAANLLWGRAHHYQKTENFDAQLAVLAQIAKLQPNYVAVWQHQAWNVSYNVSVEFDDYRHRYEWVKKGLDYLMEGITYNRDEPLLLWDSGWFFGHKLGRADEYQQFRRLFREDDDFHRQLPVDIDEARGPDARPDNWKVAYQWFSSAQKVVDAGASLTRLATHYLKGDREVIDRKKTPLRGKNPLIFFSDAPKALINYADGIQKDGYLDEVSLLAWRKAGQEWENFGDRPILSTYGFAIRLNEKEARDAQAVQAATELETLLPELATKIVEERRAAMSAEELALLDKDPLALDAAESQQQAELQAKLQITPTQVAEKAPPELREQALAIAKRVEENSQLSSVIGRYREIVNFENWRLRCVAEQETNTLTARKLTYEADQKFRDGDLIEAKRLYEEAWDRWAKFFEDYPIFLGDVEGEIVVDSVVNYKRLLDQLNEPFPPQGFKLIPLLGENAFEYPEFAPFAPGAAEEAAAEEAAAEEAADGDFRGDATEVPPAQADSMTPDGAALDPAAAGGPSETPADE